MKQLKNLFHYLEIDNQASAELIAALTKLEAKLTLTETPSHRIAEEEVEGLRAFIEKLGRN